MNNPQNNFANGALHKEIENGSKMSKNTGLSNGMIFSGGRRSGWVLTWVVCMFAADYVTTRATSAVLAVHFLRIHTRRVHRPDVRLWITKLCTGLFAMYSWNQRFVKLLYLSAICAFAFVLIYRTGISWSGATGSLQPDWPPLSDEKEPQSHEELKPERVMLVVASQTTDNTTWLNESFTSWEKSVYLTDAPSNLSVPANKGRESMVYLTFVTPAMSHHALTDTRQVISSIITTGFHHS